MTSPKFPPNRREVMAGLGAAALVHLGPAAGHAQGRPSAAIKAGPESLAGLRDGPPTMVWGLSGGNLSFQRGEVANVAVGNGLPVPLSMHWRGLDGANAAEPLLARMPLAAGANESFPLATRQAGTFLCDSGLLGDGLAYPLRSKPLIVLESDRVPVDRDEVLFIEEWRLRPDGAAIAPGTDPKDAKSVYTVNGSTSFELSAGGDQRLRLRFINGCQRTVLAVKLESHEVRVVAIDGQPAEPFPARNGAVVLAPGSRADVFVDTASTAAILLHDGKAAHLIGKLAVSGHVQRRAPLLPPGPLASNGLPAELDLRNAQRFDLALGAPSDWARPADFKVAAPPAFRARKGRAVVLALTNRAPITTVFHLHGHHFRLLDKLDDGWKPFWLDTLAIESGQTQRIAFLAEHAGRYLVESVATDWAAPRLVRWYAVE
ncbi:multicopper oxidase family protein [Bradyrhizobium sp.]|uniref:multicopper oxidase family protein n=1 Tax=Bradyrhizobium sp. TaxID=376 RepID=UPI002BACEAB1|nr:multicopper oxidase domain-containing protein [Bradyrhizobium sp.]HMM91260.1 multicopper oxidase domain-containing protein [Bradyrhizobium sp.]